MSNATVGTPPLSAAFDEWAIVEIMGHQTYAGRVTEQTLGGQAFVRVDVPELRHPDGTLKQKSFTKLFGAGSIYCISPCEEALARLVAEKNQHKPLEVYELPEAWQHAIRDIGRRALPLVPATSSVTTPSESQAAGRTKEKDLGDPGDPDFEGDDEDGDEDDGRLVHDESQQRMRF